MTKPELDSTVIFRIPRFSFKELIVNNWDDLKECIRVSSPEFYNVIGAMSYEELLSADSKIQLTVRKYYNRASFRCTPYGLFSTIGVTSMNWNKGEVKLAANPNVHIFMDWPDKPDMSSSVETLISSGASFISNSTYYCIGKEIRYIQKAGDDHQIAAVDYDETILIILNLCRIQRTFNQISYQIDLDAKILLEYLNDLLTIQLLFSSQHPNIIGTDYFSRINYAVESPNKQYLITERKSVDGELDQKIFRFLPDLVLQMQKIIEASESAELKRFKELFTQKFDQAEIPLMIALDPEAGIGYGDLETRRRNSYLTDLITHKNKQQEYSGSAKLREKLYQAIYRNSINGQAIELSELIDPNHEGSLLPNSLSALCTLVDEHLYIDSLGGSSATALLGRFALANNEIHAHCKKIAAMEQLCNQDVLLFDVGYTKEDAVDNVNRRAAIYDLQLNILNFDTSDNPLCANDILISIQRGEVVLRSRSLDKRLVPRFASAYNYKRADLPLFRLLMDIQSQGIHTNLTLRPSAIIPNLAYYPRIQFQNIVVSPATWLFQKSLLKNCTAFEEKISILSDYCRSTLPCSHVRAGLGDQTLLLDTTNKDDVGIMLSFLEREGKLYIEEAYIPQKPAFTDPDGKPFFPQLVVTLSHSNTVWHGIKYPLKHSLTLEKKEWVSPGKEWLYFEIYGNPFCLDDLLLRKIKPFVQTYKPLIASWFFIWYNENGDHIRLRIRLKDIAKGYILITALTDSLKEQLESGAVADIRLCTYKKEVHRYSAKLMEQVEEHFCRDSQFVFSTLPAMLPDGAKYHFVMDVLDEVYKSNTITGNDFDRVLRVVADGLKKEHQMDKESLKRMNQMFKEFELQPVPSMTKHASALHQNLKSSIISLLDNCPEYLRQKLLADLMHMHINRLFVSDQRVHELVIYEFFQSITKRRKHLLSPLIEAV
jgi:thiopeptide-type bacteriocin biosynthesis protein